MGAWPSGDKIKPQWIDGGARFSYGVSNGAGERFVLVDPAAGIREPAFDHARLAAALAAASGHYVRKRAWDFLVRELMGTQPPAYRPAPSPSTPRVVKASDDPATIRGTRDVLRRGRRPMGAVAFRRRCRPNAPRCSVSRRPIA